MTFSSWLSGLALLKTGDHTLSLCNRFLHTLKPNNSMTKTILLTLHSNLGGWHRLPRFVILLCFAFGATVASAQSVIKGKITDESSQPMPGVNVVIKGTATGTTSDADGAYSLALPDGSSNVILVFSFIGYTTEEVSA